MRFRFCCTCGDGGEPKHPTVPSPQTNSLPSIITQEPRCSMDLSQIQLGKITEASVEESSVIKPAPVAEEELATIPLKTSNSNQESSNPEPIQQIRIEQSTKQEPNHESSSVIEIDGLQFSGINEAQKKVLTEIRDLVLADKAAKTANPLPIQSNPVSNINAVESPLQTISVPPIINQQPKHILEQSPVELDKITEVSVEDTSVVQPVDKEKTKPVSSSPEPTEQTPIKESTKEEQNHESSSIMEFDGLKFSGINEAQRKVLTEIRDLLLADKAAKTANPLPIQSKPTSTQKSNIQIITNIYGDKLILNQIAQNLYQGTFKSSLFFILEETIDVSSGFLNEHDKAAIKHVYNEAMTAMQRGMKEMAGGYSALKDQEAWNPPPGSAINTNFITRKGENAEMTFKYIGQGHFRSTYEGKDFVILNGKLLVDESFDEFDRQLIMQTYDNTLLGMQQGLMGMEKGMKTMEMASSLFTSARGKVVGINSTSFNLTTGQKTLRNLHSTNHDGDSIAKPQQPVMVIEDITDDENTPKKRRNFDQTDGSTLTEPVLQKTTFNPQATIYDDPKTYDEQDKNELPLAKRNDEYIISPDANFDSTNRYHFHKARPKRVFRPKLTPREKFRLESPEKYSLFEDQCLKLHNQYRKLHGVPPLVHNEFLAQVAKEWAEHLALKNAFYHRPKNEYGENLYCAERMPCCARMAVKAWYDEIDLYDYDNPKLSREVGHFTQLVWKDTREIGTGVAQIGDKVWVCCNYHPPGNYLDKINEEFIPRPLENSSERY